MKLLKFGVSFLGINALLIGLEHSSAQAFTLDLFTDANEEPFPGEFLQEVIVDRNNLSDSDLDTGLSGTDLGQRNLEITLKSGSRRSGNITVDTFLGEASISSQSNTTIDSAKFTWGSDSTTPQDITDGGTDDSFLIDIVTIDLETGVDFTFTVEDSDGDTGSITQNIASAGDTYFPYETLTNNFPSVNQTAVREISLDIANAPTDFDTSFAFIESAVQPVPFEFSPSLGLVLCGGLFGISKLKKKLKRINA